MTIKRLGPLSCAKVAGVVYAILGLLLGGLFSTFAFFGSAFWGLQRSSEAAMPPILSATLGISAIIFFPILYGVIGFVFALIGAWVYNLIAARVGGIEIDIS